jgi:hypothetical protein
VSEFEIMNPLLHSFLHGVEITAMFFVALYLISKVGE